jgi:hypothetical protein
LNNINRINFLVSIGNIFVFHWSTLEMEKKENEQHAELVEKSWWRQIYDGLMEFVNTYNESYEPGED